MMTYEATQEAVKTQFIITPELKKKLHWSLEQAGLSQGLISSLAANGIRKIGDLLRREWADIPAEAQKALRKHGFNVSGASVRWMEQRVFTMHMQSLLGCSPQELGIAIRNCNCLEEERGVKTVEDLLRLSPNQLMGIRNFGDKARIEVMKCLEQHGFVSGPNIVWIDEQDTQEYQLRKMESAAADPSEEEKVHDWTVDEDIEDVDVDGDNELDDDLELDDSPV